MTPSQAAPVSTATDIEDGLDLYLGRQRALAQLLEEVFNFCQGQRGDGAHLNEEALWPGLSVIARYMDDDAEQAENLMRQLSIERRGQIEGMRKAGAR